MFKRIIRLMMLLILGALIIPVATAQSGGFVTAHVAVHSGPKSFAPVFDSIPANTSVTVEARDLNSTWYFVRTGNHEGWIPASFVTVYSAVPQGTASGFVNTDFLNVRWEPNLSRAPITQLEEGDVVIVSGRDASGNWYFVQRPDNKFGWVSSRFITVTAGNVSGAPVWQGVDAQVPGDGGNGEDGNPYDEAPGNVTMTAPVLTNIWTSATAQQITVLQPGTTVSVLASTVNGESFYLIRLNDGRLGWIRSIAVSVSEAVQNI